MLRRLRRLLPTRERLHKSRWLAWLGPRLHNPILWRWSRHEVALGAALGVFFSLTLPLGHMPLAAGAAVALRANIPMALAATWVINPVTMGPIYYAGYRLGTRIVGPDPDVPVAQAAGPDAAPPDAPPTRSHIAQLGKPLLAGMAVMATAAAVAAYALTRALWWLLVWLKRARTHGA